MDASNIFAAGQLGVAIGRATEKKGLRVLGFSNSSVIKHDHSLYEFYENTKACIPSFNAQGNLACCRAVYSDAKSEHALLENETTCSYGEELSDFSDNELSEIDFLLCPDSDVLETTHHEPLEEIIDLSQISALFKSKSMAPSDVLLSHMFEDILQKQPDELKYFVNKLFSEIKNIFLQNCGDVSQKHKNPLKPRLEPNIIQLCISFPLQRHIFPS